MNRNVQRRTVQWSGQATDPIEQRMERQQKEKQREAAGSPQKIGADPLLPLSDDRTETKVKLTHTYI